MNLNLAAVPNSYDRSTFQQIVNALKDAAQAAFVKNEDVRLVRGERFTLKSPNGTEWELTVDNAGTPTWTPL